MSQSVQNQNVPAVGADVNDASRLFGKFSAIGPSNEGIIANFNPTNGQPMQTVKIPSNLEAFAMAAFENKLQALAGFSGPFEAYAAIDSLYIYN